MKNPGFSTRPNKKSIDPKFQPDVGLEGVGGWNYCARGWNFTRTDFPSFERFSNGWNFTRTDFLSFERFSNGCFITRTDLFMFVGMSAGCLLQARYLSRGKPILVNPYTPYLLISRL